MIGLSICLTLLCLYLLLANLGLVARLDRSEKRSAELEKLLRESMDVTDKGLALLNETFGVIGRIERPRAETRH
jgi:hypothetical protein